MALVLEVCQGDDVLRVVQTELQDDVEAILRLLAARGTDALAGIELPRGCLDAEEQPQPHGIALRLASEGYPRVS